MSIALAPLNAKRSDANVWRWAGNAIVDATTALHAATNNYFLLFLLFYRFSSLSITHYYYRFSSLPLLTIKIDSFVLFKTIINTLKHLKMIILMILTLIQFWPAIFSFGRPFSVLAGHFQFWPAIFKFGRFSAIFKFGRPFSNLADFHFWP